MNILRRLLQVFVCASFVVAHAAHAQTLEELLKAVDEGNEKRAVFYLDRGLDPDSSDKDGNTILMIASRHGFTDLVSALIARHASLGKQTRSGDTALMQACLGGHIDVVKLLVSAGASVQSGHGWQPLHYAAFNGSADIVRFLLDKGADKNVLGPNSFTPLMMAAREGRIDAARVLLLEDADFEHQGVKGETALKIAQQRNHPDVVALLKQAGATK